MSRLNTYGECDSEGKGSGSIGCDKSYWGDLKGFGLLRKGLFFAVLAGVSTISDTTWQQGIDELKIFPYIGAQDYDAPAAANEYNTSTTQVRRLVRNGLPIMEFSYIDGNCRHKSLWDKQGFKKWDVVLFYASGMRMAHNFDLSKVTGFNAGDFSVETESPQKGTDLQMSKCSFQLLDPDQFAVQNAFFTWEELGFDAREKEGFNDLAILPEPIVAGTAFSARVVSSCNRSVIVSGLSGEENWFVENADGSQNELVSATYNESTKMYDYVVTDAFVNGDLPRVGTKGTGASYVAKDILGIGYKGKSAATLVGAAVPVITSAESHDGQIGVAYTFNVVATHTPTSYSKVGTLPSGLTLNTSTGAITGTPTGSAGSYFVQLRATNAAGTGTKQFSIEIIAA